MGEIAEIAANDLVILGIRTEAFRCGIEVEQGRSGFAAFRQDLGDFSANEAGSPR